MQIDAIEEEERKKEGEEKIKECTEVGVTFGKGVLGAGW